MQTPPEKDTISDEEEPRTNRRSGKNLSLVGNFDRSARRGILRGRACSAEYAGCVGSFDKELQVNTYLHSNTLFLIKRANRWLPQIDSILEKNGLPPDFKYLPLIESALLNDVSPKQAVGFWQILKASGKELGLEITKEVDQRYDPIRSTRGCM